MEYKYKAFISYNHNDRDSRVAQALHKRIETYVIPRNLRKNGKKKPGRVFRDEEELSASSDLSRHIEVALDESEFLVVICSPNAKESRWVSKEIAYFLKHHEQAKVLTVLTDGSREEIYKSLFRNMPEPMSLDLVGVPDKKIERKLKERFPKIGAPLLGCEHNDLVMRENKRQRRIFRGWLAGITAVAAVIIGILLWSNWQIEGKNRELDQKNEELEQQIDERLLRESELLTQSSIQALVSGDQHGAIRNAIDALPCSDLPRPYYAPAEQALFSALDLFDPLSNGVMLRDTVFEQTSPVETFCINDVGTLLITADTYATVRCFDIVSGDLIWSRKMVADINTAQIFLYPCESHGSIIVVNDNTITSIDQNTGESLWSVSNPDFSDRIELSNDGTYAVCLINDRSYGALLLTGISTDDGSTLFAYPVDQNIDKLNLYFYDTFDFSADGRYFAGNYQVEDGDTYLLNYFLTDITTGETEIFFSQLLYPYASDIYTMEFIEHDRSLIVVRNSGEARSRNRVEKFSIPDGKKLWHIDTGMEKWEETLFGAGNCCWLFCDTYFFLGEEKWLYAFDLQTGEQFASIPVGDEIEYMERINDETFSLILKDGTYTIGGVSNDRLYVYSEIPYFIKSAGLDQLGDIWYAQLLEGGYLRARDRYVFLTNGSGHGEGGKGGVIFIPWDNNNRVILRRAVSSIFNPEHRDVFQIDKADWGIRSFTFCEADTIVLEYSQYPFYDEVRNSYFVFLDRTTLEQKDSFYFNGESQMPQILRDGKGMLYKVDNDVLLFYDPTTDESYILASDTSGDNRLIDIKSARQTSDYSILTTVATDTGLMLWSDAKPMPFVPYPAEWDLLFSEEMEPETLLPGTNGYVLLDLLSDAAASCDRYYLYSVTENQWYQIPASVNEMSHHSACLGTTSPLFTTMDINGLIRVIDIPSGKQILEIDTGIRSSAVSYLLWIMDDRYLAINTVDGQLVILDGSTGEIVLQDWSENYLFTEPPRFLRDSQGKRLYIWERNGICVNVESWTILAEIPYMRLYDPVSDMVLRLDTSDFEESITRNVTAVRIPSTEELVSIGKAYLGQ